MTDNSLTKSSRRYTFRVQVADYTTLGAPGSIATITVRRGSFVVGSRNIIANRNESVILTTNRPETYTVTCSYKGKVLTKKVKATSVGNYLRFDYLSNGRLY